MVKKSNFAKNNHALTHTVESLIAVGITITLVIVFCYSLSTQYNSYDNQKINLGTKSEAIAENLINLQGLNQSFSTDWEYYNTTTVDKLNYLGFATNPTVEYGVIYKSNSTIKDGPYPKNYVGQTGTCFLAGTKIVMADGTCKNIETINVGDTVKSFDEKSKKIVDKKVTSIFHHAPEEMGDYYLIINKYLRVTPNHQFYAEKGWVTADSLKIGDKLGYSSECNTIYSIEKVYEKVETYNFEVEGNHNYFVMFNSHDILVHNLPGTGPPEANFTWFDEDGLASGTMVYFKSTSANATGVFSWEKSTDGVNYRAFDNPFNLEGVESIDQRYYVRLTVHNSTGGADSLVKIVEANKLNAEPDPDPWVLTGKNVNPDMGNKTLSSYDEGYYIMYSETVPSSNYKVYEVKEKKSPDIPILSRGKIDYVANLNSTDKAKLYGYMKNWLGLDSGNYYYNFHIKIYSYKEGRWILNFGASDQGVTDKVSVTREVSIYTPPSSDASGTIIHPTKLYGKIVISTFIGGTPPG